MHKYPDKMCSVQEIKKNILCLCLRRVPQPLTGLYSVKNKIPNIFKYYFIKFFDGIC